MRLNIEYRIRGTALCNLKTSQMLPDLEHVRNFVISEYAQRRISGHKRGSATTWIFVLRSAHVFFLPACVSNVLVKDMRVSKQAHTTEQSMNKINFVILSITVEPWMARPPVVGFIRGTKVNVHGAIFALKGLNTLCLQIITV